MDRPHAPILEIHGLEDDSPFVTIRNVCACGVIVSEARIDVRDPRVADEVAAVAVGDAHAMLEHFRAVDERRTG